MIRPTFAHAAIAAAACLAGPALAQAPMASPFAEVDLEYGEHYLATTLIGRPIFITAEEMEMGAAMPAGSSDEWERIGEIGDMVIGVDGTLDAVVVDVGGFLGIGEKEVPVTWAALRPVYEDDNPDDWLLTLPVSREALEGAEALERAPAD
jgi:hypothetical protein